MLVSIISHQCCITFGEATRLYKTLVALVYEILDDGGTVVIPGLMGFRCEISMDGMDGRVKAVYLGLAWEFLVAVLGAKKKKKAIWNELFEVVWR